MPTSDLDSLVDALAGVVRDFGRHAFDVGRLEARQVQSTFDGWAQHLITGVAPPSDSSAKSNASSRRDLAGLRRMFAHHRHQEQAEVTAAQDAFKELVWTFVGGWSRVLSEEVQEERQVGDALAALTKSLDTAAPQELKQVARNVVQVLVAASAKRKERQQAAVSVLSQRLAAMGEQLEEARKDSNTDALTRLFNRRALDAHLQRSLDLANLKGQGTALLLIDIDHFKWVNDTHGHLAGDTVLKSVSEACVRVFKRKGDFVARFGGEELAVVAADVTLKEATMLGERVRAAVAEASAGFEGQTLKVTASVGVAVVQPFESLDAWLKRADAAVYEAKAKGRDRVVASAGT